MEMEPVGPAQELKHRIIIIINVRYYLLNTFYKYHLQSSQHYWKANTIIAPLFLGEEIEAQKSCSCPRPYM